MSAVATVFARRLWAAMLWFMRRPWMKRLQRNSVKIFPEGPRRDKAWESFRKQERFARRYGLKILVWVVTLCLYCLTFVLIYSVLSNGIEQGWLPVKPEQMSSDEGQSLPLRSR